MRRLLPIFILACVSTTEAEVLLGTAKSIDGSFQYFEKHQIETAADGTNKKIEVTYTNDEGRVFAKMFSDFSKNAYVPETVFEDFRFNTKTSLKILEDNRVQFESLKNGKVSSTKIHQLKENMVASQGFDNFVKKNFIDLQKKPVAFLFGILSELDFFTLVGYTKQNNQDNKLRFGIKTSSFLLRLFVSELKVEYEKDSKRLVKFLGRSNIVDNQEKPQDVVIDYKLEAAR